MSGKYERHPFQIGEVLTLKKAHPCGSFCWTVERVGQEIGIRCGKCGHFLILPRRALEKSVRSVQTSGQSAGQTTDSPLA